MAPMMQAFGAGALIGPVIGGHLSEAYGYPLCFGFVAASIAAVGINNHFSLTETRPASLHDRPIGNFTEEFGKLFKQWKVLFSNRDMRAILTLHGSFWTL